ncbi:MAG: lipoate--protein ligase family protein [Ardenticatenaceae bacterium]|nr:lipoate--protein ligase family protein [Ardenticatenaceae bacterium]
MSRWRLITDDRVSASFGLAADEVLAQRVGRGESQPTLRLYTYRPHCALIGRFQTAEHEVHVETCRARGIAINRRPSGGGAILMGDAQLGVALMIPGRRDDAYGRARELMAGFSQGIVRGLNGLGINAEFRRKNDIEVDGRKIVGLGIYRNPSGGLLFHASLLVDIDILLMLQVLNTPFEKLSDKEVTTVAARISTVRRELGGEISLDEVRRRVAAGYATTFGVELAASDFTPGERQAIATLEREKYLRDTWVFQRTDVPDSAGSARVKTPAGLLEVRVTLAGRMLKAVFIGGDFFAADNAVADLEASLRWHSSDSSAVEATLQTVYARRAAALGALPASALTGAIDLAVRRARVAEVRRRSDPYACFVSPGGACE